LQLEDEDDKGEEEEKQENVGATAEIKQKERNVRSKTCRIK